MAREDRGRKRRREFERQAAKLLRQAPERCPGEDGGHYALRLQPWFRERWGEGADADELWRLLVLTIAKQDVEMTDEGSDSWTVLARRFIQREGGTVQVSPPAAALLRRHGYDADVAIYKHFACTGGEEGVRSYFRVGGSSREERIGVLYLPDQDAVAIWRWGQWEHDPDLAVLDELDGDRVDEEAVDAEEKERVLRGMPRAGSYIDGNEWWRDVWEWQWGVELAYAQDWKFLGRVGETIYAEAAIEVPLAGTGPDPNAVAAIEEHLPHIADRAYVEGLFRAGLNCTARAIGVMRNDGADARNAERLYDEYVRLCRGHNERVFVVYEVSTGEGEWHLCVGRVPGEGLIRVGMSDEFEAEGDDFPIVHAGRLRDVFFSS